MKNHYKPSNCLKAAMTALVLTAGAASVHAQTGIGTVTPNQTAVLELQATNKGLLIPRVTSTQRIAITTPADGLLVYQTNDTPGLQQYVTDHWERLISQRYFATAMSAGGAIIPFASGAPIAVTTAVNGLAATRASIAFGTSNTLGASLFNSSTLDLTGAGGTLVNTAFSVPRAGTIRSISVMFSNTATLGISTGTITLRAQLYKGGTTAGQENTFTAVSGSLATLVPDLSGVTIAVGAVSKVDLSGLSIPVAPGERYVLVISANGSGITLAGTIAGYISGGIAIE